jgi:hypothetical protein
MNFKTIAVLGLLLFTACESPSKRDVASTKSAAPVVNPVLAGTTLTGLQVNPVQFTLAPKWKVQLHDGQKNGWKIGDLKLKTYRISDPGERRDFGKKLAELKELDRAKAEAKGKKRGFLTKGSIIAIDEILRLLAAIESGNLTEQERKNAFQNVEELTAAFNYNFKYPIYPSVWIGAAPLKILDELGNPSMSDRAEASINVIAPNGTDLSLIDPPASSFWRNPGAVSKKDLYAGFGRSDIESFPKPCKYTEAKDGYGVSGVFEMDCDGVEYKVKFSDRKTNDETHSEAFNARLVWALGYNALPNDYVRDFKMHYDRAIIRDFNSREDLGVDVKSLFGFKYFRIHITYYLDPFNGEVDGAILKDGTRLTANELKARLLKSQEPKAEMKDENYDSRFEEQIRFLVMAEANIERKKDKNLENVGPWSWNGLDHEKRRETRAFGTLAAFLNLYDARLDNNKVRILTDDDGRKHLLHFVSDLGSGLGNASNLIANRDSTIDQYPWEFIAKQPNYRPRGVGDRGAPAWQSPFVMKGYNVIQENRSFRETQLEDARWLARKLAQVTETQFQDMLIASGFSAAEVRLGLEKLISRRENLIEVLGLRAEIPPLREVNRRLNFDPRTDLSPRASGAHSQAQARIGAKRVVEGKLVTF